VSHTSICQGRYKVKVKVAHTIDGKFSVSMNRI